MALRDAILPEFDHEMQSTRRTLERVPEGKSDWAPHPKSMKMGRLAGHVAELAGWTVDALSKDSLDVRPVGGPQHQPMVMSSRKELLEKFDKNVAAAHAAIAAASDETMLKPWSLLAAGQVIFTMPRIAIIRGFVLSHIIHHRAQLGVYLRLNDVPVPSIYGPSADESNM
ncbi:MAG TPA: DinB family protein [Candidatus Acidoferrales bacterium]|nr:DinB family protein [Candidatus Acidoferrales bacterium]